MSAEESRKRGTNAHNFSTWQTFVSIYFNENISFQKPFKDREFTIKVIETEVIAIKAKVQELSGGFLYLCIFVWFCVIFLRKRLEFLINSGILS